MYSLINFFKFSAIPSWSSSLLPNVPQQHHRTGQDGDDNILSREEDGKNPRALTKKPSFVDACLATEWVCDFQMRLDETVWVSNALPFIGKGENSGSRLREMRTSFVLVWLNESRLPLPLLNNYQLIGEKRGCTYVGMLAIGLYWTASCGCIGLSKGFSSTGELEW